MTLVKYIGILAVGLLTACGSEEAEDTDDQDQTGEYITTSTGVELGTDDSHVYTEGDTAYLSHQRGIVNYSYDLYADGEITRDTMVARFTKLGVLELEYWRDTYSPADTMAVREDLNEVMVLGNNMMDKIKDGTISEKDGLAYDIFNVRFNVVMERIIFLEDLLAEL